jgi:hypothetical protein
MAKVSRYSSYRTMTAYEATTAWSAKRKAARQKFEANQTAATDAFINAASAKIDGLGTLIGQQALDRVIAEGKAKTARQAELAKLDTTIDSHKADIQDSIFSSSSSGTLDSGTQIDLNAGTITLSDGTVIDAKTGAKKINIVT